MGKQSDRRTNGASSGYGTKLKKTFERRIILYREDCSQLLLALDHSKSSRLTSRLIVSELGVCLRRDSIQEMYVFIGMKRGHGFGGSAFWSLYGV